MAHGPLVFTYEHILYINIRIDVEYYDHNQNLIFKFWLRKWSILLLFFKKFRSNLLSFDTFSKFEITPLQYFNGVPSFIARFFNEKFLLIDWRRAVGVHNYVKVLVNVLFSDNNSDVFKWNWLILGTLIDKYVRYYTKQEL